MWWRGVCTVAIGLTGLAAGCSKPVADVVYHNGRIYTLDDRQPWAEAVAIKDGKFVLVGTDAAVLDLAERETRRVDLKGLMVLPGLFDSHIQPLCGQLRRLELQLPRAASPAEILSAVESYAAAHADTEWIRGGKYDASLFADAAPHRQMLDAIVRDRAVYLEERRGNAVWVNSRALELAGVTARTRSPVGGLIERDEAGEPTGVFRGEAIALIRDHIPPYDYGVQRDAAKDIVAELHSYGVTGVKAAPGDRVALKVFNELDRQGNLPMRIAVATPWRDPCPPQLQAERELILEDWFPWHSPHVYSQYVKIDADGAPTGTAAMVEPHRDGSNGRLLQSRRAFRAAVIRFDYANRSIMLDSIGDAAARSALDWIADARASNPRTSMRHQLAHSMFVSSIDLARCAALDVVVEFSPPLWMPTAAFPGVLEAWLEPERIERAFPVRTAFESGAVVVFGSDWPEGPSPNPWPAIEALVTRANPTGEPHGVFGADQAIGLAEALKGYTINGAYAMHKEAETGSIEAGKSADMIVLNQNLFEIPPDRIGETRVWWTVFEGRVIYRWDGQSPPPRGDGGMGMTDRSGACGGDRILGSGSRM